MPTSDAWEASVLAYVADKTRVTTKAIMVERFHWENPALWTQAHTKRIGAILRQHGWVSAPYREGGMLVKGYVRTSAPVPTSPSVEATSNSGSGDGNTHAFNSVTGVSAPCVHDWQPLNQSWTQCTLCLRLIPGRIIAS